MRLDLKASLEYRRPESLEDNPQDVDAFLKRNDMEGLLKKGPARKNYENKEKAAEVEGVDGESKPEESRHFGSKDVKKLVETKNEENFDYDEEDKA